MTHRPHFSRAIKLILVSSLFLIPTWARAAGGDAEVRVFTVSIDGSRAGTYHMTIQRHENGSVSMVGQARIRLSVLGVTTYHYTYTGSEVWSNGRLYALESKTNDDGKEFTVSAKAAGDAFKITTNGQERTTRPDVWLSTYWHTPDARFHNKGVPLVDADTGKDLNATLRFHGNEEITVLGQRQTCAHYRLRGGVTVDCWYDGQDRLVRVESVDDGHRVVQELTNVH